MSEDFWGGDLCRSNMCNEWRVLKWTFASFFWKTRLCFFFSLWAKYSIYTYILFDISNLPSEDLDKHKPITNLRRKKRKKTKNFPLVLFVYSFKWCYLLVSSFRKNRLKDMFRALTLCLVCVLFWHLGQVLCYGNGVLKDKSLCIASVWMFFFR